MAPCSEYPRHTASEVSLILGIVLILFSLSEVKNRPQPVLHVATARENVFYTSALKSFLLLVKRAVYSNDSV